jgi:hypothetical protein
VARWGKSIAVDGVTFDHGLSKRQIAAIETLDVVEGLNFYAAISRCGVPTEEGDDLIRTAGVAVLMHPSWEEARSYLDRMLLDLTISPDDDFVDPKSAAEAIRPVCLAIMQLNCRLAKQSVSLRHRNTAARMLGFADQLAPVDQALTRQVGELFVDQLDFKTSRIRHFHAEDMIAPLLPEKLELGEGWHPDPWGQSEYRRRGGDGWTLDVRAYGQEFSDRVGKDTAAPSGDLDPTSVRLYRLFKAWYQSSSNATAEAPKMAYQHERDRTVASANTAERLDLVLNAAELARVAKHAVAPDDDGDFALPTPPVPVPDEMDLSYRLLDTVRRWLAGGFDERAREVAQIIVNLGPDPIGFALERAFSSALERGERNGWTGPPLTSASGGPNEDRDGPADGRQPLQDGTRAAPEQGLSPEETDDYRASLDRLCDLLVAEFVSSLDSSGRDTRDSRAGGMCFGIATEGDPDGCLMFLAQRHTLVLGANQGTAETAESLVRSFGFDPVSGHDFPNALDQFGSIRDGVLELMITGDEMETSQAIQAVRSRGEDNTVMVLRAAGLLLANLEAAR